MTNLSLFGNEHATESDLVTITGTLSRVRHERGGWFAGVLERAEGENPRIVSINGTAPTIPPIESELSLSGAWEMHPTYGQQFRFQHCAITLPSTKAGIVRHLKRLPGIGEVRAEQLYNELGEDTLRILHEEPERLRKIKGLGKWLEPCLNDLEARKDLIEIQRVLDMLGFGGGRQMRVYEHFHIREDVDPNDAEELEKNNRHIQKLLRIVQQEPYRLVEVPYIGFAELDAKLLSLGWANPTDPARVAAAMFEAVRRAAEDGHTWVEESQLGNWLNQLKLRVAVPPDMIDAGTDRAAAQGMLARVYDRDTNIAIGYAVAAIAEAEQLAAERLVQLLALPLSEDDKASRAPRELLEGLNAEQRQAVELARSHRVLILTGGPGTGKTHTTNVIIKDVPHTFFKGCAPTGKAARRASELTGMPFQTIHLYAATAAGQEERAEVLSKASPEEVKEALKRLSDEERKNLKARIEKSEETPNPQTLFVIDEFSMVSIDVLAMLFRAVTSQNVRLVLVGDVDQLPSVGPGAVLRDMIESKVIPLVRLHQIMRQAVESRIVMNAHAINQGRRVDHSPAEREDWFSVLSRTDGNGNTEPAEYTARKVVAAVRRAVDRWGYDPIKDVQVLAPMRRGALGIEYLNTLLREAFNPSSGDIDDEEILTREGVSLFRQGDKVLVTANDYRMGVVNGDVGVVSECRAWRSKQKPECVSVLLEDADGSQRQVEFEGKSSLKKLTQAWAMTIHKSQGSEYPCVVMVLDDRQHYIMCQRALLYTGITRARERLVFVGTAKAIAMATKNVRPNQRVTRLRQLLVGEAIARGIAMTEARVEA